MATATFNGIIVFSKRDSLRSMFRTEAKSLGFADAVLPKTDKECIEQLFYLQGALLVLDWNIGAIDAAKVLTAAKGHYNVETRPTLLIVDHLTEAVAALAAEFGVSMILTGEVNRVVVKERLSKLRETESQALPLKEKLIQVAFARERKEFDHASRILLDLRKQFPSNLRVVIEIAENFILLERWEEAQKILEPIAEKAPPNLRAIHLYGRCLAKLGQPDAALKVLEKAKLLNPYNAARLVDIGNIFLEKREITAAKGSFAAALDVDEKNKPAMIGQTKCLLLEGEVNDALEILRQISGPQELAAVFNTTAVLAIRHGDFEKGMALYQQAMKAVGQKRKLLAKLHFNSGIGYHRWSKPELARQEFEKAAQLDPGFHKAQHNWKVTANLLAKNERPALAAGLETATFVDHESQDWNTESFLDLFEDQGEDEFD